MKILLILVGSELQTKSTVERKLLLAGFMDVKSLESVPSFGVSVSCFLSGSLYLLFCVVLVDTFLTFPCSQVSTISSWGLG